MLLQSMSVLMQHYRSSASAAVAPTMRLQLIDACTNHTTMTDGGLHTVLQVINALVHHHHLLPAWLGCIHGGLVPGGLFPARCACGLLAAVLINPC